MNNLNTKKNIQPNYLYDVMTVSMKCICLETLTREKKILKTNILTQDNMPSFSTNHIAATY